MSLMHVEDVMRVFNEYEPSKLLLWEIVRSFHAIHTSALIYILDNAQKKQKCEVYVNNRVVDRIKKYVKKLQEYEMEFSMDDRPALNIVRVTNTANDRLFAPEHLFSDQDVFIERSSKGLTIMGLLNVIRSYNGLYFVQQEDNAVRGGCNGERTHEDQTDFNIVRQANGIIEDNMRSDTILNTETVKVKATRVDASARVLLNNLCTKLYTKFLLNIEAYLFPDEMQEDRNDNSRAMTGEVGRNITQKFIKYYKMVQRLQLTESQYQLRCKMLFSTVNDYEYTRIRDAYIRISRQNDTTAITNCNVNPKTFRTQMRSAMIRIHEKPIDLANMSQYLILQPLLRGFRVIISANGSETRIHNRYGELLLNFLYYVRFDISCTFEAIVLPIDTRGRVRNWRYWPFRDAFCIVVVDVFRFEQQMLTHLPFNQRASYIARIKHTHIRSINEFIDRLPSAGEHNNGTSIDFTYTWNTLESRYTTNNLDMMQPIGGLVLRYCWDSIHDPPYEYRFHLKKLYDFRTDEVTAIHGNVSLKLAYDTVFDLEMAMYRTVCMIYAHDDQYYYSCVFDRNLYKFRHIAKLPRIYCSYSLIRDPSYRVVPIYILNAQSIPRGVAFLRVYYNANKLIVGYDMKLSTSMYDIPYDNDLFSNMTKRL